MMPVVSLNTYGARRLKNKKEMEGASADAPVAWESKVDKFNKRLRLVRAQCLPKEENLGKVSGKRLEEMKEHAEDWQKKVQYTSLYEFNCKYYVSRNRVCRHAATAAVMVTPGLSGECTNEGHARHEEYARMCVVAFWRMMPTKVRYEYATADEYE